MPSDPYNGPDRRAHQPRRHEDEVRDLALQVTGSRVSVVALLSLAVALSGAIFAGISWGSRTTAAVERAVDERREMQGAIAALTRSSAQLSEAQIKIAEGLRQTADLIQRVEAGHEQAIARWNRVLEEHIRADAMIQEHLIQRDSTGRHPPP